MTHKVIIKITHHPNGQFSVGKNMGGFLFKTREEADAYAGQLQERAGGPDEAKIIVHDFKRRQAERSAARLRPRVAANR